MTLEPPTPCSTRRYAVTHEILRFPGAEIDCSQQHNHPSAASVTLVHVGFISLQMSALRNLRCRQGSCSVGVGRGGRGVGVVVVVVEVVVGSCARTSGRAARRRTGRGMCILNRLVVMMMGGRGVVELKGNSDGSFS